ncbi:penicillin-binding protein 1C [Aquabacterium sp. A7-Y]|nr:penicillin-binding protein 1C [Aquabacterium sp. A7-Y]MCW7536906.1 penicillin-binding protein 1C [Aquabacterium sp. A7-Y]
MLLALDQALPPPLPRPDGASVVLARDGTPLRTYPSGDGIWRQPVGPERVSPLYLQALLNYEDRWFYWHFGVNPLALLRAGWQWASNGRVVSGGSTLTMQVARIIDPPPPGGRGLAVKLRQMARAVQLELRLSKAEILTLYLHHAPMGGIVEGVEMASRSYLGKSSEHLSHAEAALLAALPQAPSRLRPDRAPQAAQAARDKVLARLAEFGVWSAAEIEDARIETVAAQPIRGHWLSPLAAERVRRQARAAGRPATALTTTIDIELQASVERMLLDRVNSLPPKVSMAALVMHNDTLEVLAYAGSADFADRSRAAHVDMVRGVRSPGSTLKPFLYALALDDGLVHGESLMVDAPQSFGGYQPGNFQASFSGPVSLSQALQRSLNVPAVDLLDRLGPPRFAAMLRAGGLKLRLPAGASPNLSLILGGAGTTLEELVGAYRALARGGVSGQPRLTAAEPRLEARLMSEGAAFIVRDILEAGGHPDRPFAEGVQRVAWKTGTSFGFRDAWAIGVTDHHTVGVWVGRPDGTPNPGFFGANVAAPLLRDIVAAVPTPPQALARRRPASVSSATTCWPLGLKLEATDPAHCGVRHTGWVLDNTAPPTLPDRSRSDGLLATRGACGGAGERHAVARWPAALEPWLRDAVPQAPGCETQAGSGTRLRIAGLEPGARLKPAPRLPHVDLSLSVVGGEPADATVYWLVDGRQQRRARADRPVTLRLADNGPHAITVLDGLGRYHRVDVVVSGLPERQAP